MNLEAFMIEEENKEIEYVASKRFIDSDNKPIPWRLRAITAQENQELRKVCYHNIPTLKKGQYTKDFDTVKYLGLLAERCVVFPNLLDAKLQDFYHVKTASELLGRLLNPGEYDDLTAKLQEVNGYDLEGEVNEAKN